MIETDMKRLFKLTFSIVLALLLLCTGLTSASAQTSDEPTSYARRCTYENAKHRKNIVDQLSDKDEATRVVLADGEWVSLKWTQDEIDFVYYEWTDKIGVDPAPYTVELLDAGGNVIETVEGDPYWNNGFAVPDGVFGVRLTPHGEAELCTLIPYAGGAPKNYHPWEPTVDKADFLVIAMHPDDDALFMGNVVATYGAQNGYTGTILYLATRTRIRRTEALNGAWVMGLRTYPLMAGLPDIPVKYREEKKRDFLPEDVSRVLVRYLRRLRPEIVITHDDNGEYGHWQHMIVAQAIRTAVVDAANVEYDPESAAQYGAWQVKKLYLHLAEENPIFISCTKPLDAFDGRTGLQVAQEAYQCHQSQRLWNHLCNNENECSLEKFGLVFTTVGTDSGINDMFEHITFEPDPMPTPEPTPEPTEEPTAAPTDTPSPTPEPTLAATEKATSEPLAVIEQTPDPTVIRREDIPDRTQEDRGFWIALGIALALIGIGVAVTTVLNLRTRELRLKDSPKAIVLVCLSVLLLLGGIGVLAGTALPKKTEEPEPTADVVSETPEPVTSLKIRKPSDLDKLAIETLRTVEIDDGVLDNAQIASLVASHPDLAFTYSVQIGSRFVSPDVTELTQSPGESYETLAEALPYLPKADTLHLQPCTPQEIETAQTLFSNLTLDYDLMLYGQTVPVDLVSLDLSAVSAPQPQELFEALPYLSDLEEVILGDTDADTALAFDAADLGVNVRYTYSFEYLGRTLTESTELLDLSAEQITDLDALKDVIAKLPKLNRLEMLDCGIDDETMAELRDAYPDIKVVWEIDLGFWGKLRTDATAFTTRSSKRPDELKYRLTSETVQPLQYCTDLVALDLGHQQIEDISCLKSLTKLQILILADNKISDLTAISYMPDLIYLELFMNRISDVSPLSGLKNLKDLNICTNHISDLTPFYSLTSLERLWYSNNDYKYADHVALQEQLPNCICDRTVWQETEHGWREHERYFWMRSFFENSPRYIVKNG